MSKTNGIRYALIGACIALISSCAKSSKESGVEYFSFQETTDGQWGMMSPSGEVLFSEEFKEKPTVVRDGRFMVRNKDGMWEIYTAEAKPQKIGTEYAYANMFQDGIALVAEKGKPVSIIDTDAKVVKLLDKIDGKTVDAVERFSEGYAVYKTDKYLGVINSKGSQVIKPEYIRMAACSDGKFIALHKKYEQEAKKDSAANLKFDVLSSSGKVLFSLSNNKYKEFGAYFRDGLLDVYTLKKGEKSGGIINDKGEEVVKPTAKIKKVGQIRGEYFTYNNGDGWGVMNLKGESVIRAKYDELYFASDDKMVAVTEKEGGSSVYKYVDMQDNQIGEDTYDAAFSFDMLDGQHALVKVSASLFSIVDAGGKQVEKLPDIVSVGFSEGDYYVESDYVDMKVLADELHIKSEGVDSLTFKSSPLQVVRYYIKQNGSWEGDESHKAADPYWYTDRNSLLYYKYIKNVAATITVNFSNDIAKRDYRTKRVIDYTYGDWYWYHDEKIPTGYSYTSANVASFRVEISNEGAMRGKLRDLYKELSGRFRNLGKVAKENNGAVVVTLNNGLRALVAMEKDKVFALWGNIKQVNDIDISAYKDVKEEPKRRKDYDYFESDLYNTAAVDSVEVEDSVEVADYVE